MTTMNLTREGTSLQNLHAVITVDELAQILRIGKNNAYALIKSGEIPSIKVGHQIRIASDDVYDFLHTR